jgi:hypothetical protein
MSSSPSWAGADFGYIYTADVEEPRETEVMLWATDRHGKGGGDYGAQDYRVELERGITARLQVSAYVNFASHHIRGLEGEFDHVERNFAFQGFSAELKYQLTKPTPNGWGLAVYGEPGWSRISKVKGEEARELELELKAILQKNFLGDRLVWATNVTLEPEWEREREVVAPGVTEGRSERELAFEVASGLSYRVVPRFWVGVETRYHSVYPDWTHGLRRENYAVYAGPSVHYDVGEWGVTATWLPQLFGAPNGEGSSREFDDHEKSELRVKVSREF